MRFQVPTLNTYPDNDFLRGIGLDENDLVVDAGEQSDDQQEVLLIGIRLVVFALIVQSRLGEVQSRHRHFRHSSVKMQTCNDF